MYNGIWPNRQRKDTYNDWLPVWGSHSCSAGHSTGHHSKSSQWAIQVSLGSHPSQSTLKITTHFSHLQYYNIQSVCIDKCPRLISEKPADSHTVEMSVVEVYNNEVLDLLARDEGGATVGVKREVITTSTGTSEVPCLTYEWVTAVSMKIQNITHFDLCSLWSF